MYRRILRVGQNWTAKEVSETATERQYITEETRRIFRENKSVKSEQRIQQHIREAEARLTMAEHYRNPYPRPVNLPPGSYTKKEGKKTGTKIERLNRMSKPVYVASIDDTIKDSESRAQSDKTN